MKLQMRSMIMLLIIAPGAVVSLLAWGFWGHQQINRAAVFLLPPELFGFYKTHIDWISAHAVDPDKRRYADPEEAARHFIDLDRYGENPFDSLPRRWEDAVAKFGEDSLKAHGIVPWHVVRMQARLTQAFRAKDVKLILRYSAEIGHYIADAHVPLHCTRNYNGQLTGQHGIHGLWESRLPELLGDHYDRIAGTCTYIASPSEKIWQVLRESYAAHDSVLQIERQLSGEFPPDRKYTYEERGTALVKVYSKEYASAYNNRLNGMVERRFRAAMITVASCWYTAWVNAGMPTLNDLPVTDGDATERAAQDSLEKAWQNRSGTVAGHED